MGKKNKKDKKGKGKEKTALKTEKNAEKRAKKELAEKGEDDIEKLIAEFQSKDKKRVQVVEEKCDPPSPRCNMTMSAHPTKEELIMFGGEYCTGNKTYMYNDLFFYNIKKKEWTKVTAPNAPPPRSSHQSKSGWGYIFVIMYSKKGVGCVTGKVIDENSPLKWKWVHMKQSGTKPTARCGMSLAVTPGHSSSLAVGGAYWTMEDEEDLDSVFYNEMYTLDLERGKWFPLTLRGKKSTSTEKRKRRKKKEEGDGEGSDEEDNEEDSDMDDEDVEEAEEDIKKLKLDHETDVQSEITNGSACALDNNEGQGSSQGSGKGSGEGGEDEIFKVTVSEKPAGQAQSMEEDSMDVDVFLPPPRMGTLMAVRGGELFLYGGLCEVGDRQITFSDFYSLDLHKLDDWTVLIHNKQTLDWDESDSDDEQSKGAIGGKEEEDDDDDDDDEDDSDDDIATILEGCDVPHRSEEEAVMTYFERTKEFWETQSQKYFKKEDLKVTKRTITKFAKELCQEYCN
ncbi:kelch domain-containing protein 4-like [Argopecten irradians]|uniref:kelch domain-containing protein 4-like n=1 Tax=Argopecten irradians TaxID=31199 RepID=UPI003715035A